MRQQNLIPFLFWTLLLILLFPVWSNKFFLTGDGPCHVYNAKVLLDLVVGNHADFYREYYSINPNPDPNWFSHVVLALLQLVFPGYLAEKIMISGYVLGFALALRWCVRQINVKSEFLVILGLPFIFHHTFQMGFYNYAWSLAFFFYLIGYWLKYSGTFRPKQMVILGGLLLAQYFMHPIGLGLTLLTIGFLLVGGFVKDLRNPTLTFKQAIEFVLRKKLQVFLPALPALILTGLYISRRGFQVVTSTDAPGQLLQSFFSLSSLRTMTWDERLFPLWLAMLIGVLFLFVVYQKWRKRTWQITDAFLIVAVVMFLAYVFQPGSMFGAGILSVRLEFVPYLLVLLWLASSSFPNVIKTCAAVFSALLLLALVIVRMPHHRLASDAIQEYLSARAYLEPLSTVLPLSYAHEGLTTDGEPITDKIWLFMHAADYLGSEQPLIMLGNYEANTGWFPLIWKEDKNPFKHLNVGQGLEHQPPQVNFEDYPEKSGGRVDYVLTWCRDGLFEEHPFNRDVEEQLANGYTLLFASENERAKLYRRQ